MKKTTTRTASTSSLEDLDFQEILKLSDKEKYKVIKRQILRAKLATINSVDIIPDGNKYTKLFSVLNLVLLHSRTAEREIEQIIKNSK